MIVDDTRQQSAETGSELPEYRFLVAGEWQSGTAYTVACPYDGKPVARSTAPGRTTWRGLSPPR